MGLKLGLSCFQEHLFQVLGPTDSVILLKVTLCKKRSDSKCKFDRFDKHETKSAILLADKGNKL